MSYETVERFLTPTKLERAKEDWCDNCAKSSCLEGPVVMVTTNGVAPWGKVRCCRECMTWIWTTLKGNVIPVEMKS